MLPCGVVGCHVVWFGVMWCGVVWCGVVGYRAIGLPVWLVEWCVGCLAGWVVWHLGVFVGCLAGWGMLYGVCTLWYLVPYAAVCCVMSCLWLHMDLLRFHGRGGLRSISYFCSSGILGNPNQKHTMSWDTWLKTRCRVHRIHCQPPYFDGFHLSKLP